MRRPWGGVGPGVVERAELGSGLGDAVEAGEQITGRARQPVEPGDEEGVAVAERFEQLGELGAVGARTGDLLAVEAVASGDFERSLLGGQALALGRDAAVAVDGHCAFPFAHVLRTQ
jgi:hypothetical protein